MKDKIIAFLKNEISEDPNEEIDPRDDLLNSGIVNSMDMIQLVLFIEKEFQLVVSPGDMTVENFTSVESIIDFISKKHLE